MIFVFILLLILAIVFYGQYLVANLLGLQWYFSILLSILIMLPMLIDRIHLPYRFKRWINIIGYIYMGAQLYLIPLVYLNLVIDFPKYIYLLVLVIVIYGIYNANSIRVKEYEIEAPFDEDITVISDVHLGYQIGRKQFLKMIHMINEIESPTLMIVGDLCDMNLDVVLEENLLEMLNLINKDIYMVMGNHDNYTRDPDYLASQIKKNKVHLLLDESIQLENYNIIGRNDAEKSKKPLNEFTKGTYNIVLDHTPSRIDESIQENIDLHISGHTHNGQLWPLQLVTNKIFKVGYGHQKFNHTDVVVSGGIGYWGPMNKSSTKCEIVVLKLRKSSN